ncbi:hypothetical protein THASP1DRAFT_14391 [Thamnocephalis sphaerospora]|uniref:Rap-GAP domain-containing protein n=1 Tax=Thamnocephalis sphaerospora TaxID=78915 RepID=A0A4P9XT92_9FUNG|nr:hypothetical protein THASP1DRAFT_14391 [Thamnocephalis sphaerospora]|eukprot:RKP09363.1 hypothetical protein THASP1DRAFT_14391 [Thamnocephalis sphaerospora]
MPTPQAESPNDSEASAVFKFTPPRLSHSLVSYIPGSNTRRNSVLPREGVHAELEDAVAAEAEDEQQTHRPAALNRLPIGEYLEALERILGTERDWTLYEPMITRVVAQLGDKHLFCGASTELERFRTALCGWIRTGRLADTVGNLPTTMRRADVFVHAYRLLTVLISHKRIFARQQQDEIVVTLHTGLQHWSQTARGCIHALTICLHELPLPMTRMLTGIVAQLSQIMSTQSVSVHILEFLSALARTPQLYANFVENDYKMVFGIALQYIKYNNATLAAGEQPRPGLGSTIGAGTSNGAANGPSSDESQHALAQYVLVLAYHVITIWFISLRLPDRRKFVSFIVRGLLLANERSGENAGGGMELDEQTQTCLDMLARYAFANCSPKTERSFISKALLDPARTMTRTWVMGNSLLTVCAARSTGWAEICVRRPSGVASFLVKLENRQKDEAPDLASLPALLMAHWNPDASADSDLSLHGASASAPPANGAPRTRTSTLSSTPRATRPADPYLDPAYLFLQVTGYPDMTASSAPVPLPDDDATRRAIGILDRTPVVDFHKVGVVYVGPGETTEQQILSNSVGSSKYARFLDSLGELIRLKGCRDVYTGGLDTEMDLDGAYAYYWREAITQLIFHAATLMPTDLERDPHCLSKKRHIGNDFVTIVYNDSGLPYAFDTLPSQFNFVQIIVTPLADRSSGGRSTAYFMVHTQCRPDMPDISPVQEPKVVSHGALPAFVRQIALHANIFAQVFLQSTSSGGRLEYVANWKERLRQIKRVRDRAVTTASGSGVTTPAASSMTSGAAGLLSPAMANEGRRRSASMDTQNDNEPAARLESLLDFTRFS